MDDAIHNGVSNGRLTYVFMPFTDRQLRCDNERTRFDALLYQPLPCYRHADVAQLRLNARILFTVNNLTRGIKQLQVRVKRIEQR